MAEQLYPSTSPYFNTATVDAKFLDIMTPRFIPALATDVYWLITPAYEFRPDLLAHDTYNDSKLWWVFAQRNPNRLKDPYFDFTTGTGIYIPKKTTLVEYLGI